MSKRLIKWVFMGLLGLFVFGSVATILSKSVEKESVAWKECTSEIEEITEEFTFLKLGAFPVFNKSSLPDFTFYCNRYLRINPDIEFNNPHNKRVPVFINNCEFLI